MEEILWTIEEENTMIEFNINEFVKVKLTAVGRAELKRQHDELCEAFPNIETEISDIYQSDEDGYTKFQLWSLMNTFGHICHMGSAPPFDTTIILVPNKE